MPHALQGRLVRLEPLAWDHFAPLLYAARDPELWSYTVYGKLSEPEQLKTFMAQALDAQAKGTDLPFVIAQARTNRIVGCTRLRGICRKNMHLEIGGTWLDSDFHRSGINLEAKYLLLRHAFEHLGMLRVQFKTDARNLRSQASLEKLGAVREGILRRNLIMPDGLVRDTLLYSILDTEWNVVRQGLEARLENRTRQVRTESGITETTSSIIRTDWAA